MLATILGVFGLLPLKIRWLCAIQRAHIVVVRVDIKLLEPWSTTHIKKSLNEYLGPQNDVGSWVVLPSIQRAHIVVVRVDIKLQFLPDSLLYTRKDGFRGSTHNARQTKILLLSINFLYPKMVRNFLSQIESNIFAEGNLSYWKSDRRLVHIC